MCSLHCNTLPNLYHSRDHDKLLTCLCHKHHSAISGVVKNATSFHTSLSQASTSYAAAPLKKSSPPQLRSLRTSCLTRCVPDISMLFACLPPAPTTTADLNVHKHVGCVPSSCSNYNCILKCAQALVIALPHLRLVYRYAHSFLMCILQIAASCPLYLASISNNPITTHS